MSLDGLLIRVLAIEEKRTENLARHSRSNTASATGAWGRYPVEQCTIPTASLISNLRSTNA